MHFVLNEKYSTFNCVILFTFNSPDTADWFGINISHNSVSLEWI